MKVGFAAIALVGSVGLSVAISIPSQQPFDITTDSAASVLNPYPNKPRIAFKPDGTFKITVFSDLHFGENPWDEWGPEQDRNSTKLMRKVLKEERPDYAVINGDLITGENTFKSNNTRLLDQIVKPLVEARVPFSTTQGNHDNQFNITHGEEIVHMQKTTPLSYSRLSPNGVGGAGGDGNYWVPIYRKATDRSPVLILWFFDSRGGVKAAGSTKTTPLEDWVDESVGEWIKKETALMSALWGPAENRAAVGFVHIAPHVAQTLQADLDNERNPGLNDDFLGQGSVQDSNNLNPIPGERADTPFWNSLNGNIKNLRAIISGHAHGNEWCARDQDKDVIFCFNKHSGYGGYDRGWGQGVRNLVFQSPDPKEGIKTWIRFENGTTRAEVVLDDNYV